MVTCFFNIHGVNLQIINAQKYVKKYLEFELGNFLSQQRKNPDIKITYTSHLDMPTKLNSIGNLAEFGKNKFFIRFNASRILLPFHNIGKKIEINSEVSVTSNKVFLESIIEPTVFFKLLTKQIAFIHSSAVFFNNTGIIFPAFMRAGKTELLFELLKKGAHYMSDDWTFVSASGDIFAYPRPILIHPHTFQYSHIKSGKFNSNNIIKRLKTFSGRSSISNSEESYSFSVHEAFPNTLIRKKCNLDNIVHILRYRGKQILMEEEDPDVIIEKIISTTKFARMHDILPLYALYKFAFPKKRNPIIETSEEVERKILKSAFRGKPVYSLKIPLIANQSDVCDVLLKTLSRT